MRRVFIAVCGLAAALASPCVEGATVLPGFQEEVIATFSRPTGAAFAPDGRLFVLEQSGRIRIVKNKRLLATPFATFSVNTSSSRGLLGIAFDPDFETNHHLYVFYVTPTPRGRISRITASTTNPDSMLAGSERVLFELDAPSSDEHNGGGMAMGADGRIYQLVGDDRSGSRAPSLSSLRGKVLRIERDGTIPTTNPFYGAAAGKYRAIWARGLRNPFTIAVHPGTGRIFVHDVGTSGSTGREEINDGLAAANYGWPSTEGYTGNPDFRSPRYAYGRGSGYLRGCAVVGGTFYDPPVRSFPAEYHGLYFFGDHCNGYINTLDYNNGNAIKNFASGIGGGDRVGIVDIDIDPTDGSLWYFMFKGTMYRIFRGSGAPSITQHPASQTVTVGSPVSFTVAASGSTPFAYQWQRNGVNITGATSTTYGIASTTGNDNGARFRCRVSNSVGTTYSNEALLTVTTNRPPVASIGTPAVGTLYGAGQIVGFSGGATDPEQGTLPASSLTWRVDFHHFDHLHPFLSDFTGVSSGTFAVQDDNTEKATDVWFRIHLTARDAGGLTHSVYRDLHPRLTQFSVDTSPPGLQFTLDEETRTAPFTVNSVLNMKWLLGPVTPQMSNGQNYNFTGWSDGGAEVHRVTADGTLGTLVAHYTAGPPPACTTAIAGDPWKNQPFAPQTGRFTARVSVTPLSAPLEGFVTLSRGPQSTLTGFANLVRFNTSGSIDARNGSDYAAAASIPYAAGVTYHFRLDVDVPAKTYSIFVTREGGTEQTLGLDYAFRIEQNTVTQLDNWALRLNSAAGSIRACDFSIEGDVPTPTPTPTARPPVTPTPTPTPTVPSDPIEITPAASGVTASTHDGNVAANTVDDSLATRWSGNGDGAWIQYDLGSVQTVAFVTIAVFNGNSRQNRFDLQVSTDTVSWTNVVTDQVTSGTTTAEELYDFPDTSGRFIRYVGHMSSIGTFNSVTEVSLFGPGGGTATPTPTATPTSPPIITPTPTPARVTPTPTPTPTPAGADFWREAENGAPTSPFDVRSDTAASGDRYVTVIAGNNSLSSPPSGGRATFTFSVTQAGTYKVWGRVITTDSDSDSFWIRMDSNSWLNWNGIPLGSTWHWDDVDDSSNNAILFNLAAGTHTLTVAYREDGARLDRLLITNRLSFTPTGTGP